MTMVALRSGRSCLTICRWPGRCAPGSRGNGQGGEHDGQVRFDRVAPRLNIGRACRPVFDMRKDLSTCQRSWYLVITFGGRHHLGGQVGDNNPSARPTHGSWLQCPVHRLGRADQLDVAVAFDRSMPVNSALRLGDLSVDAAQGAPGRVVAVLVVDNSVGDPTDLLCRGRGHGWVNTDSMSRFV